MPKSKVKASTQQSHSPGLNMATYMLPPQELKTSVLEFIAGSLPEAPIAAQGDCISSALVFPLQFPSDEKWRDIIDYALERNVQQNEKRNEAEENDLEILIQTIVEHGQRMLPLLHSLREKSKNNVKLTNLVFTLQSHLSTGINAVCLLAPREMEVLEMAAQGATNREIAQKLELKIITVAKALSRAYHKLNAKNRIDAIQKWMLIRNTSDR